MKTDLAPSLAELDLLQNVPRLLEGIAYCDGISVFIRGRCTRHEDKVSDTDCA